MLRTTEHKIWQEIEELRYRIPITSRNLQQTNLYYSLAIEDHKIGSIPNEYIIPDFYYYFEGGLYFQIDLINNLFGDEYPLVFFYYLIYDTFIQLIENSLIFKILNNISATTLHKILTKKYQTTVEELLTIVTPYTVRTRTQWAAFAPGEESELYSSTNVAFYGDC